MPRRIWVRIAIVSVVVLGSLWYLYPPKKTINLGLDLQGGIHLVLGVETDKAVASQTDRAAAELKAALERTGTGVPRLVREGRGHSPAGPTIARQGQDRILIQLHGVQDPERAKALIGKTALLEFKLLDERTSVEDAQSGRLPEGSELLYQRRIDKQTKVERKVPYV